MDWRVASQWCARELTATIGNHLVHVHIELGAAARHPDMQGKHVVMLTAQDFVASLDDQFTSLIIKPLAGVVRNGSALLQGRVGGDHFAGDQICSDAEVFERALCLRSPQLVRGYFNDAKTVSLFSHAGHLIFSCTLMC